MQWVATEKLGDVLLAVGDADLQGSNTDCACASGGYPHRLGTQRDLALSLAGEGGAAPAAGDTKTALGHSSCSCSNDFRLMNGP